MLERTAGHDPHHDNTPRQQSLLVLAWWDQYVVAEISFKLEESSLV